MKIILNCISIALILSGCTSSTANSTSNISIPTKANSNQGNFETIKQSCLNGVSSSCIEFGYLLINNQNYQLAKTSFSEAFRLGDEDGGMRGKYYVECLENNAESCNMLGWYFENGKGGKQDYALARVAYEKSIELGSSSLIALAILYAKGLGGEQNQVKAARLFDASCHSSTISNDLKIEACYNLGYHYQKGLGVRQDNFKAIELYKLSCSNSYDSACNNLGNMYYYGKGIRQDSSIAQMYYGKACDLGSDTGCENYAKMQNR
jgi:TPR repeat protein